MILYHFYIMKKIFFHKFTHRGPFIVLLNGIFIQWNTNKAHPRMPIQCAQLTIQAPTFKSLPPTAQRVFSGQATASCSSPVPRPTLITSSGNQGVSQHLHSPPADLPPLQAPEPSTRVQRNALRKLVTLWFPVYCESPQALEERLPSLGVNTSTANTSTAQGPVSTWWWAEQRALQKGGGSTRFLLTGLRHATNF